MNWLGFVYSHSELHIILVSYFTIYCRICLVHNFTVYVRI